MQGKPPRGRVGRLAAPLQLYAFFCTNSFGQKCLIVQTTRVDNALVLYAHCCSNREPVVIISADNASEFPRVMDAVNNVNIWMQ